MTLRQLSVRAVYAPALLIAAFLLALGSASADTTLELKNYFIDAHRNRATIEATFSLKFAHSEPKTPSPSKPSNDGDHISGTAPEIGLLTVAEIMNAADFPKTLQHVQNKLGDKILMVGVWRIWHCGESHQSQGEADANDITDTNLDHIFEIHPLIQVGPLTLFPTSRNTRALGARSHPRGTQRRSASRRPRTTMSSSG